MKNRLLKFYWIFSRLRNLIVAAYAIFFIYLFTFIAEYLIWKRNVYSLRASSWINISHVLVDKSNLACISRLPLSEVNEMSREALLRELHLPDK